MTATSMTRLARDAALLELRGWQQPARLVRHAASLPRTASRPQHVMVLPGFATADFSTTPLRWYLRRLDHHVQGWELGTHQPHVLTSLKRFTERLETAVDAVGEPFVLVGWSLGGVIARETARDRPDLVAQVITFGSPIAGPRHASLSWVYNETTTAGLDRLITTRLRRRITVPTTTIYSRRDGIVDWRHAIDTEPVARNIEVSSSHLGLSVDPDVWRIVATTIDTPPPIQVHRHSTRRSA